MHADACVQAIDRAGGAIDISGAPEPAAGAAASVAFRPSGYPSVPVHRYAPASVMRSITEGQGAVFLQAFDPRR